MQYELPPHPEHTMQWSPREQRVIVNHVNQAIEPLQKRIADLEAQTAQLTASLETASSAVIVLKQQQREGWAQIASGQEPVTVEQIANLVRTHLTSIYACTRVWEAWQVGTMTEDDFIPASEIEMADEIAEAVVALLTAPSTTRS